MVDAAPADRPSVIHVWTPTPDEQFESELSAALSRPGSSRVIPLKPVALTTETRATGWLWGRQRTPEGAWVGLATIHYGTFMKGATLGWHRTEDLRTVG